jgi:hypothetical protein
MLRPEHVPFAVISSGIQRDSFKEQQNMSRLTSGIVALALLAIGGLWLHAAERTRADIKELMKKTNKGEDSPWGKLSKELKADEPSWSEVQKQMKEVSALSAALGECKELTKPGVERFQKSFAVLEEAAGKKDKKAALAARQMMLRSCMACHYGGAPAGTGGGRE